MCWGSTLGFEAKASENKCTFLHSFITECLLWVRHWGEKWQSRLDVCPYGSIGKTKLNDYRNAYRRRQWHPTPVLLPGKSRGRRRLEGCSHGVAEGRTRLSDFTFTFHFHALEKEMATHSSVLAWRIPGTGRLVGCHLWGHTESDTTEVT